MAANSAKQTGANQNSEVPAAPLSNTQMAERYNQVQALLFGDEQQATTDRIAFLEDRVRELEDSAKARFEEMSAYIDKLTTEMAKTADKRFADLETELEARDRRQTQHRRRMVSTGGFFFCPTLRTDALCAVLSGCVRGAKNFERIHFVDHLLERPISKRALCNWFVEQLVQSLMPRVVFDGMIQVAERALFAFNRLEETIALGKENPGDSSCAVISLGRVDNFFKLGPTRFLFDD